MSGSVIELLDSDEENLEGPARLSLGTREDPLELENSESSENHPTLSKRVFIAGSSDDGCEILPHEHNMTNAQGRSVDDAICILSDDESETCEASDGGWLSGDIRRPSKTVFASKFAQLIGSPAKHSSPGGEWNRRKRGHLFDGTAEGVGQVGKRNSILGCTDESMYTLGRKDTASSLGRRIRQRGRLGVNRILEYKGDEQCDAKNTYVRKDPDAVPKCNQNGRHISPDLSYRNDFNDRDSPMNEVAEETFDDDIVSIGSTDIDDSGNTGGDASVSSASESDDKSTGSAYDDCGESNTSEHSINAYGEGSEGFTTQQRIEQSQVQEGNSSGDVNGIGADEISMNKLVRMETGILKQMLNPVHAPLESVPTLFAEQAQVSASNEVDKAGSEDDARKLVRRTTRKATKRSHDVISSNILDDRLSAHDPHFQRTIKRRQHPTRARNAVSKSAAVSDEKYVMNSVPHLARTTYDANGIPTRRFTVHTNNDDSILYDFEVQVKQSKISADAGLGAFLVFRGGRVLDQERIKLNEEKKRPRTPVDPGTLEKLEATYQSGSVVLVTLTGKHLHGHNNSIWRPITDVPMRTRFMNKVVKVRLVGDHLHYDMDEDEQLGLPCCPIGIGHLFMNTESEYSFDRSIVFCPRTVGNCALLELGRYGPARKEDRKRKADFDVKCFLFDQEPSGWCYGLNERRFGCEQIVDITDDVTGEVHEDAKKLPAIYVNEVGHDRDLIENVQISQIGGVVQYHIDVDNQMKAGDEIELLCNYQSHYETTRERKGYGLENVIGQQRSDKDKFSILIRNFGERLGILEMIEALSPLELYHNLEFLSSRVLPGVDAAASVVVTCGQNSASSQFCSPAQLIARRRLHWLAPLYRQRIAAIEGFGFFGVTDNSSKEVVAELRETSLEWVECLKWDTMLDASQIPSISDQHLLSAFESETIEEVLFCIRDHFKYPMDLNLWCSIALDLTKQLCVSFFQHQLRFGRHEVSEEVAQTFLTCAYKSAEAIRISVRARSYEELSFRSGAEGLWKVKLTAKNLVTLAAGSALLNSTVLKGAVTSLIDQQVCQDNVNGAMSEEKPVAKRMQQTCDSPVVIVTCPNGATPRRLDVVQNQDDTIHETWYLIWQVLYPVYSIFIGLSKGCSSISTTGTTDDFFNDLCRGLNLDIEQARRAVDVGIRDDLASPQMSFAVRASTKLACKGQARPKAREPTKLMRAPKVARAPRERMEKSNREPNRPKRSRLLFFDIVWKALMGLGWNLVVGTRPTDFYFLPPGVTRGRHGFKNRVHYFDSYMLVLNFIQTDSRWKEKTEVRDCLSLYEGCKKFLAERKIKGEFKLEFIIEQVRRERMGEQLQ